MKKILFLSKYGRLGASSRYRIFQYLDMWKERNFQIKVDILLPDKYIEYIYSKEKKLKDKLYIIFILMMSYIKRFLLIITSRDINIIFVQYEGFPYLPFFFERVILNSGKKIVLDFDDADHIKYNKIYNGLLRRIISNKQNRIIERSNCVIVANKHLYKWAKQFNSKVEIIPTSVKVNKYDIDLRYDTPTREIIIGWIGTPNTSKHLSLLKQPLSYLSEIYNINLKLIGLLDYKIKGINVKCVEWSEIDEAIELASIDIGIMPLYDNEITRGKSGLKILQYFASKKPAVASPVGANCQIIDDGINGYLANGHDEWINKLSILIEHESLRKKMGLEGRKKVEREYSIKINSERFLNIINSL